MRVVTSILLALTLLGSSDAQGNTGHASDLDITKERPTHGRHMLAHPASEQDQQNKRYRVKRHRRKPTPKHKRRGKTDHYTESHSKDGSVDQWTRTHSVSRLGPRRSRLSNRSQTKRRRRAASARRAKARLAYLRLVSQKLHARKQKQGKEGRSMRPMPKRKHAPRARNASKGIHKRKSPASRHKASPRRKALKARPARKKATTRAKRHRKVRAFLWKGKGAGGFKWNSARRARPHRIPWKGQVVYDEGDVICVAESEQELMETETQSAEIHAQAGMPPAARQLLHWGHSTFSLHA